MIYKIILTESQKNNLLAMLNRVDLKGEEALAWVDLINIIQRSEKIEEEVEK